MKIKVADLKKALSWIDANSRDVIIDVDFDQSGCRMLELKMKDKYATDVTIKLFQEGNMLPRIIKEDQLSDKPKE